MTAQTDTASSGISGNKSWRLRPLEEDARYSEMDIVEFQKLLFDGQDKQPIHLIVGAPGVGKSLFLQDLKKYLEESFLLLYLDALEVLRRHEVIEAPAENEGGIDSALHNWLRTAPQSELIEKSRIYHDHNVSSLSVFSALAVWLGNALNDKPPILLVDHLDQVAEKEQIAFENVILTFLKSTRGRVVVCSRQAKFLTGFWNLPELAWYVDRYELLGFRENAASAAVDRSAEDKSDASLMGRNPRIEQFQSEGGSAKEVVIRYLESAGFKEPDTLIPKLQMMTTDPPPRISELGKGNLIRLEELDALIAAGLLRVDVDGRVILYEPLAELISEDQAAAASQD